MLLYKSVWSQFVLIQQTLSSGLYFEPLYMLCLHCEIHKMANIQHSVHAACWHNA